VGTFYYTTVKVEQNLRVILFNYLFDLDSLTFSVISSSIMNNLNNCSRTFKDAGKYSRTTKCFSRIKDITTFQIQRKSLALKDVWQL